MQLCDEGSFQAHGLDGCRSVSIAGNARGRDLGAAAANQRSAADGFKETRLLRCRPNDIRQSEPELQNPGADGPERSDAGPGFRVGSHPDVPRRKSSERSCR